MQKPSEETVFFIIGAFLLLTVLIIVIAMLGVGGPENFFAILQNMFGVVIAYLISKLNLILHG